VGILCEDLCKNGFKFCARPNAISNAIGYGKFCSRSHIAVVRVFDESDALIETHESGDVFLRIVTNPLLQAVDRAPMRRRSSGIFESGKQPAKSPGARWL
jgi:hypothetical protein